MDEVANDKKVARKGKVA